MARTFGRFLEAVPAVFTFLPGFFAMFPASLASVLYPFRFFTFSGSRSCPVALGSAVAVASLLTLGSSVLAGCTQGVEQLALVSAQARGLSVFKLGLWFHGHGALFCSFPSGACPSSVHPSSVASHCFGGGSGSWASLAFAVGCGAACLVVLPAGVSAPLWLSSRASSSQGGAWGSIFFVPSVLSGSLFF